MASHYAARRRGLGHIFVANEGLTALATIMPPTFVGSEFRSPSVFAPAVYVVTGRLANGRFVDECHLMRERIKCRFGSPVGHGLALPRPWAIYLAAHHGGTISSTLGVDFVAASPRFRFPIQPWLSVAHSLEKLFSTRHWNNEILSAFGRYQPAADDTAAPATISSPSRARTGGTKYRKAICPCRSYPTRAGNFYSIVDG